MHRYILAAGSVASVPPRLRGSTAMRENGRIAMGLRFLALTGLAMSFVVPALAQDKGAKCTGPRDECQQNVEVWKNFDAAYGKHDAAATAALFTDDGVWVFPDATLRGRPAIEKRVNDNLKAGYSNEVTIVDEVHVVADTAWVDGHWSGTVPGPNNTTQPVQGRWGSVHGREGDGWKIRMSTVNLPPK
jgi:uncharacterized protein (TIGR02246 family)